MIAEILCGFLGFYYCSFCSMCCYTLAKEKYEERKNIKNQYELVAEPKNKNIEMILESNYNEY